MKDEFKRETIVDFSCWDINSKWVHNKHRAKDAKMCKRKARRKNKTKIKDVIKNIVLEQFDD